MDYLNRFPDSEIHGILMIGQKTICPLKLRLCIRGETLVKRHHRIFAAVLAFLLAAGLTVGCTQEETVVETEKENITLWYYWSQRYSKRELAHLVDGFNQSQDKVEVTTQYVPDEDFKKRLALSMADGNMPELALVDSSDFKYFNAMEAFVDLTDEIDGIEGYLPEAKEACMIDGRMKGLPYGMNCTALFYNEEVLKTHGIQVPKTWKELLEAAVSLSDDNHCGFAMPALQSEESVFSFLPLLWSMGGDVDALESEGSRKAFHFLRQLTELGAMSRQTINLTSGDLLRQFVEGNIAMMINSTTMIDSVNSQNPNMEYGVTRLPAAEDGTAVSVLGGEIFGVAKGEHQDAAIEFLRYISDKEHMAAYMERSSYMAPRLDVLENQYKEDPLKRNMIEVAKSAKTREFSVEWPYISLIITNAMEEEIIGEKDEKEILRNAASEVAAIREGRR